MFVIMFESKEKFGRAPKWRRRRWVSYALASGVTYAPLFVPTPKNSGLNNGSNSPVFYSDIKNKTLFKFTTNINQVYF